MFISLYILKFKYISINNTNYFRSKKIAKKKSRPSRASDANTQHTQHIDPAMTNKNQTTITTQSVLNQLATILKKHIDISSTSTLDLAGLASISKKIRQTIDEGCVDEDVSDAFASKIKLSDVTRVMNCIIDMSTTRITFESVMEIAYILNSIAEISATFSYDYMEREKLVVFVETTQKFWRYLDTTKISAMLSSDRKIVRRALRSSVGLVLIALSEDKTNFQKRWKDWPSGLMKVLAMGLTAARDPCLCLLSAQCILSVMTMLSKTLTKKQQVDHLTRCDKITPRIVNVLKKVLGKSKIDLIELSRDVRLFTLTPFHSLTTTSSLHSGTSRIMFQQDQSCRSLQIRCEQTDTLLRFIKVSQETYRESL